jgi:hypothetical protein
MTRCKNCGWENPNVHAPCEKCGATLTDWLGEQPSVADASTETPDVRKTAFGCPECGYPLRPADRQCPNCNASVENAIHPTVRPVATSGPTVIASPLLPGDETIEGRRLAALLVTYSIRPQGDSFPVFEGKNFIGRDASAGIRVAGDAKMSEKHLSILYRAVDKKFKFKDEQSSNGTFINNVLTDEGELQSGDVITAGATKFLFLAIPDF